MWHPADNLDFIPHGLLPYFDARVALGISGLTWKIKVEYETESFFGCKSSVTAVFHGEDERLERWTVDANVVQGAYAGSIHATDKGVMGNLGYTIKGVVTKSNVTVEGEYFPGRQSHIGLRGASAVNLHGDFTAMAYAEADVRDGRFDFSAGVGVDIAKRIRAAVQTSTASKIGFFFQMDLFRW